MFPKNCVERGTDMNDLLRHTVCGFLGLLIVQTVMFSGCRRASNEGDSNIEESNDTIVFEDTVKVDSAELHPALHFESVSDLLEYIRTSEDRAAYREGIIPTIAEHSLEYANKLMNNKFDRFIIVDKGRMKVILYDKFGRQEKIYGMGCAKNFGTKHKKADSRTPEGFFSVSGTYDSTDWLFRDDNGKVSKKKGQFGPRFIRLMIPGTSQIGIHGTCAPWSIGGRVSHGCIRITNENILELVELVTVGMPVIVVPGKRDMLQNRREGYDITWIPSSISSRNPLEDYEEPEVKEEPEEIQDSIGEPAHTAPLDSVKSQEDAVVKTDTVSEPDEIE